MSGFSFPPPPPPPPPQAFAPNQYHQGHRGGFGDRGSRDRGKDRGRGRGRGDSRGGFQRGGRGHQNGSFTSRPQSHAPNGSTTPTENGHVQNFQGMVPTPQPFQMGLPFHTPDMASSQVSPYTQQALPPSPHANTGAKRSHLQAFDSKHIEGVKPKPQSKPKVFAPPVIPSFGFALPAPTAAVQSSASLVTESVQNKKKSRTKNSLGLTPLGEAYEDSEDDVDEEASFTTSSQGMVQHGGRSIQLNTAADVAAWIAERRRNFPTAAKIAAKKVMQEKAREEVREAKEVERKRREEERDGRKKRGQTEHSKQVKTRKIKQEDSQPDLQALPQEVLAPQSNPLARIAQLEEQLKQAREALLKPTKPIIQPKLEPETAVQEAPIKIKSDPEDNNTLACQAPMLLRPEDQTPQPWPNTTSRALSLAYESADDEDDAGVASVALSEMSSIVSSDSDDDSDLDSDAPPDEESTKGIIKVDPPLREGPNRSQICFTFQNTGRCKYGKNCSRSHDVPCRFYVKTEQCKYGNKCRMSHDVTPGTASKRNPTAKNAERPAAKTMMLRERMIEQELKEEARLGVQIIKQLAANGFFDA